MEVKILTIESELESVKRLGYPNTTIYLGDYAHKFDNNIVIRWVTADGFTTKKQLNR